LFKKEVAWFYLKISSLYRCAQKVIYMKTTLKVSKSHQKLCPARDREKEANVCTLLSK